MSATPLPMMPDAALEVGKLRDALQKLYAANYSALTTDERLSFQSALYSLSTVIAGMQGLGINPGRKA